MTMCQDLTLPRSTVALHVGVLPMRLSSLTRNPVISIGMQLIGIYPSRFCFGFSCSQKNCSADQQKADLVYKSLLSVSCASYIATLLTMENLPFLPASLVFCHWKTWITEPISFAIQMQTKTTVWQCKLTPKSISWTANAAVSWLKLFCVLLIGQTAGKWTLLFECGGRQRWWGSWACLGHHTTSPLTKLSRAGGCHGQAASLACFWQWDEWTCDRLKALALPQTLLLGLCVTRGGGMVSNHQHSTP